MRRPPLAHVEDRPEMNASLPAPGGPYHFFAYRHWPISNGNAVRRTPYGLRLEGSPKPIRDGLLLRADGVGIDLRSGKARMPEPFLQQIDWHT